jgi:hypothetical protein
MQEEDRRICFQLSKRKYQGTGRFKLENVRENMNVQEVITEEIQREHN